MEKQGKGHCLYKQQKNKITMIKVNKNDTGN